MMHRIRPARAELCCRTVDFWLVIAGLRNFNYVAAGLAQKANKALLIEQEAEAAVEAAANWFGE